MMIQKLGSRRRRLRGRSGPSSMPRRDDGTMVLLKTLKSFSSPLTCFSSSWGSRDLPDPGGAGPDCVSKETMRISVTGFIHVAQILRLNSKWRKPERGPPLVGRTDVQQMFGQNAEL